jgi:aspartyl protease family protein
MFALLLTIVVGLLGIVAVTVFGMPNLDSVPDWPIAAAVIGLLIALYLATSLGHRGERRFAFWPTLLACLSGVVLAAGAFNKSGPLLANIFTAAKPADVAFKSNASTSVRIRRRDDGGFVANSEVNGEAMTMRIDGGAATVVLRQTDAEKAGIDVNDLVYDTPLKTANGTSYLAPVRLKSVRVGPLTIDDVEGLIAKPGTLKENLLGTSFLRRLASYEVSGNFTTLRQ